MMKAIVVFCAFFSYSVFSYGQMAKIRALKSNADTLTLQAQELSTLLVYSSPDKGSLVVPQNATSAIQTLRTFNIPTSDCYDIVRALPAFCVSGSDTRKLLELISEKSQSAQAFVNTFKRALVAVRTVEARLLLKDQIEFENASLERAKTEEIRLRSEIEKLASPFNEHALNNYQAVLAGIMVALVFIAFAAVFPYIGILAGASLLHPHIVSGVLLSLFLGSHLSGVAINKVALADVERVRSQLVSQQELIKRKISQSEIRIQQEVDFFDMVNKAALEGEDSQKLKTLP